jgi:hypothetical protein
MAGNHHLKEKKLMDWKDGTGYTISELPGNWGIRRVDARREPVGTNKA